MDVQSKMRFNINYSFSSDALVTTDRHHSHSLMDKDCNNGYSTMESINSPAGDHILSRPMAWLQSIVKRTLL